jgi:hypothetical protein
MSDARKLFGLNSKEHSLSQEDSSIIAYRQNEIYDNAYVLLSSIANIDPELVRDVEAPKVAGPDLSEKNVSTEVSGNVINFAAAQERAQEAEVVERIEAARRLAEEAQSA